MPPGTELILIPELDGQHPALLEMNQELESGQVPEKFNGMVARLEEGLIAALQSTDVLIVHNIFTKHFNLPLTAALFRLLDQGILPACIAWCHDMTWTSPNSRSKVFPAYPWDLLRTYRPDITYVAVSEQRKQELVQLFNCPPEQIQVIYNGVDPADLLALSEAGLSLIGRLGLWNSDLNLLLPVRITQAKNIEFAIRVAASFKGRGLHVRIVITGPPDPHDPKNMEYFHSLLHLRQNLDVVEEVRFIYESGPSPAEPYTVDMPVVAELFRVCDALLMPSHREGFGMPVLEAGLVGIPVFCSDRIPAGNELGDHDIVRFSLDREAGQVADLILEWMGTHRVLRLKKRVWQEFTWRSIFQQQILPLITQRKSWGR
jgi:mannosylglucosylglycerate synthase